MQNEHGAISFRAHESDMARMERDKRRWIVAVVFELLALVGSNAWWLFHFFA